MAKKKRRFEVVQRPNLGYLGKASWMVVDGYENEIAEMEDMVRIAMLEQAYVDELGGYGIPRQ